MSRPGGKDANQRELLVKFKVEKFLGKGSYGSVFAVKRLSDNQTYALKVRVLVWAYGGYLYLCLSGITIRHAALAHVYPCAHHISGSPSLKGLRLVNHIPVPCVCCLWSRLVVMLPWPC
jgi:hypothetical protein